MRITSRGGSRDVATSKMECFVITVNGWKPLTIITKCSILDVAVALETPLRRSEMLLFRNSADLLSESFLSENLIGMIIGI